MNHGLTKQDLVEFEAEVARRFDAGEIHGPVHLNSETQAEPLLTIFEQIQPTDWVLGSWRSHYHALLKGVPRERVMAEILAGRSMMLHFPEYRFMTSAIVGGMLPIACGLAYGGERVWCFVGDMTETTGIFHDAMKYSAKQNLDVRFVIEDNGLSTNTPTDEAWGLEGDANYIQSYYYERTVNHYQSLPNVQGF